MAKYTPLYVSERIGEWYHNIVAHRYEESTQNKMEAEMLIQNMEPDDKIISFFTLIKYKHQLTFENKELSDNQFEKLKKETPTEDAAIQVLVYDYAGQSAYLKGEFIKSIEYYQKVEKLLPEINDEYEQADFYKRLGILFYRIKQFVMASMYLKRARDIFAKNAFYKLNEVSCKIVLAGISSEGYNFTKAEQQYDAILAETNEFVPALRASTLQGMGVHYQRAKNFEKAEKAFKEILKLEEVDPIIRAQSLVDLANVLFQRSKNEEAAPLLTQGLNAALALNDTAYICHAKTLKYLYQDYNLEMIDVQLEACEEFQLYFKAAEIVTDVADFHKKQGKFEIALKYTEHASKYKIMMRAIHETKEVVVV